MKNISIISLFLVLILFACKINQSPRDQAKPETKIEPISINMPNMLNVNQNLNIEISTTMEDGIILYDPMLIRIERFENDTWKSLRILHCPCGANCSAPPREQLIKKGETWSMSWNLIESWCENVKGQDIPNTIELKATPGKYRSTFNYSINTQDKIKLSKEFQLTN